MPYCQLGVSSKPVDPNYFSQQNLTLYFLSDHDCEDNEAGKDRNLTFEKAESFFSRNKLDLALECYLKCIKGIERGLLKVQTYQLEKWEIAYKWGKIFLILLCQI